MTAIVMLMMIKMVMNCLFQEVHGYKQSRCWYYLSWVLYLLTVGVLRLLFYWLPHRMVQFTHSRCSLDQADKVIMKVSGWLLFLLLT